MKRCLEAVLIVGALVGFALLGVGVMLWRWITRQRYEAPPKRDARGYYAHPALVLAFLLVAATAHAGHGLVIYPRVTGQGGSDNRGNSNYLRHCLSTLDALGASYDLVRSNVTPTSQVARAAVWYGGFAQTYDWIVVLNWSTGTAIYPAGFSPDSLTRHLTFADGSSTWPDVPILYVFTYGSTGSPTIANAAACSTGVVTTFSAPFGTNIGSGAGLCRSVYATGSARAWKTYDGMWPMALQASPRLADSAIVRPLLQAAISSASNAQGTINCTDCDGMTRAAQDSTVLWRRSPSTLGGTAETGVPEFFCVPTVNDGGGGANFGEATLLNAYAALDSAAVAIGGTRAAVINNTINTAVVVNKGLYHGAAGGGLTAATPGNCEHGLYLPDSTVAYASLDSLQSLGIKISVGINADRDTISAYQSEYNKFIAHSTFKFFTELYTGLLTGTIRNNATQGKPMDVWGLNRTRTLATSAVPYTCASTDTTLYCLLKTQKARGDSLWKDRSLAVISPPAWDWVPNNFTRATLPTPDSLARVLWYAGYRTLIVNPDDPGSIPGSSFGTNSSAGAIAVAVGASGLFPNERRVNVYGTSAHATRVGSFMFAASRGQIVEPDTLNIKSVSAHAWWEEMLWGVSALHGPWYPTDYPYYYHTFRTHLSVYSVDWGTLAGNNDGRAKRSGYFMVKWYVNPLLEANARASHPFVRFVYADEL